MHMYLIDKIWKEFERLDLKAVGEIEQCLATGVDKEGVETKTNQILKDIII